MLYGTPGYQPPEFSDDNVTPTPPSDLFTVGRTLAVLCTNFRGFQSTYEFTLPPQSEVPLYERYDSLYRFLQRATALESRRSVPDRRRDGGSALRHPARSRGRSKPASPRPRPARSSPANCSGDYDRPDWRTLPALLVSADDPASGYLASVGTTADDANALVAALEQSPVASVEVDLSRARALIEAGRAEEAATLLDEIAARQRVGMAGRLVPRPDEDVDQRARGRARRVRIACTAAFRVSSRPSSLVACAAESAGKIEARGAVVRHRVAHRPQLHQRRVRPGALPPGAR